MRSILLATNDNGRLPFFDNQLPVPLLPVANRALMIYGIEVLVQHSIKDITICLHKDGPQIEQSIGTGNRWNVDFQYLQQKRTLGSAGAVKHAGRNMTESLLVLPADRVIDLDIPAVTEFHMAHGGPLTAILSSQPANIEPISEQPIKPNSGLNLAHPFGGGQKLYYTGAYLLEPEILNHIPEAAVYGFQLDLVPGLLDADIPVHGFQMDGYWNPIDSFLTYLHAQETVLFSLLNEEVLANQPTLRFPYTDARQREPGIWCYQDTSIDHRAQLMPPVLIGQGSQIGRNAEIGPNVVIGPNTIVDEGAGIQHSTILSETYIGKLLNVNQKVVSKTLIVDINSGDSAQIEDPILLAETNPAIAATMFRNGIERLIALLAMIALLPVMVLLMIAIKIWIGSPVLCRTSGTGKQPNEALLKPNGEQPLSLYQFRTRRSNGSIVMVGRWLERWGLYRLPELWNIVLGEMGLVGFIALAQATTSNTKEE